MKEPPKERLPLKTPLTHLLPRRCRPTRFSSGQKLIFYVILPVVVLASLPLGAYLTAKYTQQQQAQIGSTPLATAQAAIRPGTMLDPERLLARYVDQEISRMSLDEELGQLLVVRFNGTALTPDLQYMIAQQHIGGAILYSGNVQGLSQIQTLDAQMQAHSSIPLFISTDQEGGITIRLRAIIGWTPSAQDIGATNDPQNAYKQGVGDAQALKKIGANVNLAPVVDVQTVSNGATIIPTRMFGSTPQKVTTFAGAYLDGLQEQGIIGCLKHWPGLGAATVDPHHGLPVITRSQADLNAIDFAPYRALLSQGKVDMIMTTHELVPAYDPTMPASVSPVLINQVLRHDLGYQGVVITDTLTMGGLSYRWTLPQAAVLAFIAGDDLLLGPSDRQSVQAVIDALHAAVVSGKISKARLDLSVERILGLKIKYGLIHVPQAFGHP
jgi:beta-N-acetylhexosaminidase